MPEFLSRLSIRAVLGLVIGLLGCVPVALGVTALVAAVERNADAARVMAAATASRQLFNTLVPTRIERGTQISALLADGPIAPDAETRLLGYRRQSEINYHAAIASLDRLGLPALTAVITQLRSTHAEAMAMRPLADAAIAEARPAREAATHRTWLAAMQAYVDALIFAGDVLDASPALATPAVSQLLLVKRAAWTARSHYGLASLRMETAVIAGRPWTEAEIVASAEDRARAAGAWAMARETAARAGTPKRVVDKVAEAEHVLGGPMAARQQAVFDTLTSGGIPAIAVLDLQKLNTGLLDGLVEVANITMNELVLRVIEQQARARRNVVLNALMLAGALLLTAAGLLLVHRRVSRPITAMTEVMHRLAERDVSRAIPGVGRGDEIGRMAAAVEIFRDKMLTADRLAAELRDTQAELVESARLAFLGSMVAGIAHEVNTPVGICVTAMSTADDVLAEAERSLRQRELTEDGLLACFEKQRQTATLVMTNLERAASLIRRFKSIAADQVEEVPRRVELGAQLGDIVASLQPELKRTAIEVRIRCPQPVEIVLLPGALWQIVSNLVLNGVIHAFEPGVAGTITLAVRASQPGWATLSYVDDGRGMPADVRKRIFEPFFTTRRGQGGTGLGLFITYNLATQTLGGRIRCDSRPGEGTRFEITIPTSPPPTSPPSLTAPAEALREEVPVP